MDTNQLVGVDRGTPQAEVRRRLGALLEAAVGDGARTLQLNNAKRVLWVDHVRAMYNRRLAVRPEGMPKDVADFFALTRTPASGGIDPRSFKAPNAVLATRCNALAKHSVLTKVQGEVPRRLAQELPPLLVEWGAGAVVGMVLGDAFGAPVHNTAALPTPQARVFRPAASPALGLRAGQWTWVAAGGLCLLDSFFVHDRFDGPDFVARLFNWAHFSYNSSQAFDPASMIPAPVAGADAALGEAFDRLLGDGTVNATATDTSPGSAASLARVAAAVVGCGVRPLEAEAAARAQSLATDGGEEAAEACRLLAHLMVKAYTLPRDRCSAGDLLHRIDFETTCEGVADLAAAKEPRNWKRPDALVGATERLGAGPRGLGARPLDALFVAFHCVWSTDAPRDALIMAASVGGQACLIASITGQLSGALHGVTGLPAEWVDAVQQWDKGGSIVLRAVLTLQQRHAPLDAPSAPPLSPPDPPAPAPSPPDDPPAPP